MRSEGEIARCPADVRWCAVRASDRAASSRQTVDAALKDAQARIASNAEMPDAAWCLIRLRN